MKLCQNNKLITHIWISNQNIAKLFLKLNFDLNLQHSLYNMIHHTLRTLLYDEIKSKILYELNK